MFDKSPSLPFIAAGLLLLPTWVGATHYCDNPVAKVISIQGRVEIQAVGATIWQRVNIEDVLCDGDMIRTAKSSRATIVRPSGVGFTMPQYGTLMVKAGPNEAKKEATAWYVKLLQGMVFFRSREPEKFYIQTPFINAVHKGTEFLVDVSHNRTEISVFDGLVAAENAGGSIEIAKGQKGVAREGVRPQLQAITIKPEDAVQWALYYPSLIDVGPASQAAQDPSLIPVLAAYRQGDIASALEKLDALPDAHGQPRYTIMKAALQLATGNVNEAELLIQQMRQKAAPYDDAYVLDAIIAIAKNRRQEALMYAEKAVATNPKSPVAYLALSYAKQAQFDIEAALAACKTAAELEPGNALSWARQAELQLSLGDKDAALKTAEKAVSLNPDLARTQTVLGFVMLSKADSSSAALHFEKAIKFDSGDPLARIGLGLAKVRSGDIESGKAELEAAVNLDPNNAVARSYLGKAFYELRDKDYAGKEFELAKELDPNDPTSYFYDAILKQSTNRPVEALHAMDKAVELNDNRGVYRSTLLMDKDSAARSAAQGRIYNELGFQQQGLLEGWKSTNKDFRNYSAHRLLADTYAGLPRHEVARVSELLQSQLMQPVNITPIQANLAESEMLILNGLGPSEFSFNEFNPLFEYDRYALQSSGLYGSNGTWGDNTAISGLHENFSFSLGQLHYTSNGFRKNNRLTKDLYNVFVQSQVTDDLNLQAEFRHEESDNGDLTLNFNLDNFSKELRQTKSLNSYRVGGHYKIDQNSSVIASVIYQDLDFYQRFVEQFEIFQGFFIPLDIRVNRKRTGFISEIQHIYDDSNFSLITGLTNLNLDITDNLLLEKVRIDSKTNNNTLYHYLKYHLSKEFTATLGLSVDFIDNADVKYTPVNPKFGIEWRPSSSTTLRAAVFRNTSMYRTASQTIQPTQVAGFNQYFDEADGTMSWRYGAGMDHKFTGNLAAGLEYSERKLYMLGGDEGVDRAERMARAYVYWTPLDFLALSTEYFYENIDHPRPVAVNNTLNGGMFDSIETHRIPVTLSFFDESGFSLKIRNSYVNQSGSFHDLFYLVSIPDETSFWVTDLNLSYRLPKRYGMMTFGVNNLFDHRINFQNTNINENLLAPERMLFTRVSLAF